MVDRPENIDYKYNLKIYFGLLKKYKWLFIGTLFFVLITEATYTADKFLFKIIIDNGTLYADSTLDKVSFINILLFVALIFGFIIIIRAIGKWLFLHFINRLDGNIIIDLKTKFFNHIIALSHSFHTTHRTGSLISRLTRGGSSVERMTDILSFNVAPLIFQLIIVSASLLFFDKLSALVIFLTVVLFVVYSVTMYGVGNKARMRFNNAEDFEKGNISDIYTNIDSIKYFGKEKQIEAKYAKISTDTKTSAIISWDYYRWIDAGQSIILAVGTFFLLYFPILKFIDGTITLGTLIFIYTVYGNLINPLFGFVHGIREYYRVMADFESLFEYGKIDQEVKDKDTATLLVIEDGYIEFRNITFFYGERQVFKNFTLKIPKKKKIALVGHSGCGKSTLVKLLFRFYDINDGGIFVDNENIKDMKQESLRSEMSVVPQECVLFDDTVYNNIAFSRPDATREEVLDAIRFAQLDKIIQQFPKKEETIVGERGVKLSGGEKQRVSIARAILANKKVLVLDEATSSLDSETEHDIQADLEKLMTGRTSIIIAHRLSTIMKADQIIVMKDGKIVQKGTHKQLIKKAGEYKKLWNLQKGGYIKS